MITRHIYTGMSILQEVIETKSYNIYLLSVLSGRLSATTSSR